MQASAWETRVGIEDAERTRSLDRALAAEDQASIVEAQVRTDVAQARAESEVVQSHRERWRVAVTKEEESLEEEALAEAFRPKNTR
jgi:hypothetical protein